MRMLRERAARGEGTGAIPKRPRLPPRRCLSRSSVCGFWIARPRRRPPTPWPARQAARPARPQALERALNEIVRRHEILRTTFVGDVGGSCPAIAPALEMKVPVVEAGAIPGIAWRRRSGAARRRRPAARSTWRAARSWHRPPALVETRSTSWCWRCTNRRRRMVDRSVRSRARRLYTAFSDGRPSPLPDPTSSTRTRPLAEALASGREARRHLEDWRRQLLGPRPFSACRSIARARRPTYAAPRVAFVVAAETVRRLKELARRESATPFMSSPGHLPGPPVAAD